MNYKPSVKSTASRFLQIDDLTVYDGETLCVVGPTGAGKTTFLRLLSGLDAPTSGRLLWQGAATVNDDVPLETLRVTMVHQRPLLLSETVWYNVEYGLKVRGVHSRNDRLMAVLAALGLSRLAKQDARTLSGGQVQLVASLEHGGRTCRIAPGRTDGTPRSGDRGTGGGSDPKGKRPTRDDCCGHTQLVPGAKDGFARWTVAKWKVD